MEMTSPEAIYETDYQEARGTYEDARGPPLPKTPLPPPPLPDPVYNTADVPEEKSSSRRKYCLRISILLLSLTAAAFMAANFGLVMKLTNLLDLKYADANAKSCLALKTDGIDTTGLHSIKPIANEDSFKAFCDMETDGGGWTLVASIHESDIKRKCYTDDLWSSYIRKDQVSIIGASNWENEMTFGMVQKCTEEDYKNSAYFGINASDVMIWHVSTGFNAERMRESATFRYRTTNKFLLNYGGNLRSLFTKHKPLAVATDNLAPSTILEPLIARASEIKSKVRDWFEYSPGTGNQINDPKIYASYGNKLSFKGNTMNYGTLSRHRSLVYANSTTTAPFTMISVIVNDDRSTANFEIQVDSYRTSGGQVDYTKSGSAQLGDYKLKYASVQYYDPSYPTVCGLYFVVSNKRKWNSVEATSIASSRAYVSSTTRQHAYTIHGNPSFAVYGYMLLMTKSRLNDTYISNEELQNVSAVILEAIANAPNPFAGFPERSVLAPVTFDKGTTEDILAKIPPLYRSQVTPGFVQFNVYNYTGYPNALCPGIRSDTIYSEYVCVGGLSNSIEEFGTCGDFAGWEGKSTDSILANQPSGSAHSQEDISSTLLIFYR